MKRISTMLALMSVMAFTACKEDKPVDPSPDPVIINETHTTTEAPVAPTPPAPPEEDANGTSVSVGKDGVDVTTKNNTSKTTVKVGDGTGNVEIKK